jgi:hypothetical protein
MMLKKKKSWKRPCFGVNDDKDGDSGYVTSKMEWRLSNIKKKVNHIFFLLCLIFTSYSLIAIMILLNPLFLFLLFY